MHSSRKLQVVSGIAFALALSLVLSACGPKTQKRANPSEPQKTETTPQPKATITANPNPVPAGSGNGKTELTWALGEDGEAQVCVSVNDGPEELLAHSSKGSKEIDWIATGATYEFRLYAGTDRKDRRAAMKLTRKSE